MIRWVELHFSSIPPLSGQIIPRPVLFEALRSRRSSFFLSYSRLVDGKIDILYKIFSWLTCYGPAEQNVYSRKFRCLTALRRTPLLNSYPRRLLSIYDLLSTIYSNCRPLRGLIIVFRSYSWGLRARLYAFVRFADWLRLSTIFCLTLTGSDD